VSIAYSLQRRRAGNWAPMWILVPAVIGAALAAAFVEYLITHRAYDIWGGILVSPPLILLTLPFLAREARRAGDHDIFRIFVIALIFRLVFGSALRYVITFKVLGGGDAGFYHHFGAILADRFRTGDFHTAVASPKSYRLVEVITGGLYTVSGVTKYGGFVFFSWLSFIGYYLFYRAFRVAVPEGRSRRYAILVFFLPSLVFWPSSIGKDAWMAFTLGIAALGVAHALTGSMRRGLIQASAGMYLAGLIRPHIAGMVAIGLAVAFIAGRPPERLRGTGSNLKPLIAVVILIVAGLFTWRALGFVNHSLGTGKGLTSTLEANAKKTAVGENSDFTPTLAVSPKGIPVAVFNVLFRPLLFEVNNVQSLLAAMQNTALMAFIFFRWRWIVAAVRSCRRQPYVGFVIVYVGIAIVSFSSLANLGLLDRERQQILPFLIVLLCIPPFGLRDSAGGTETSDLDREKVESR